MSLRLATAELPGLPELLDSVVPGFVRRGTSTSLPTLNPVTNLAAVDNGAENLSISWTDPASVPNGLLLVVTRDGVEVVNTVLPMGSSPQTVAGAGTYNVHIVNTGDGTTNSDSATEEVLGVVVAVAAPGVPQNLIANPLDSEADLSWDAVTGATSYKVYRDTVFVASIGAPTRAYSDGSVSNGITYSYTVSAVNAGGESAQSTPATVTPGVHVVTPSDFPLLLWIDVDQETGTDAAATNLTDRSTNGRNLTATGGTVGTLHYSSGPNGKKFITVNTSGAYYAPAVALNGVGDCTVIFVTKHASTGLSFYAYDDSAGDFIAFDRSNNPPIARFHSTTGGSMEKYTKGVVSGSVWASYTFSKTASGCACYFNGVPMPTYSDSASGTSTFSFKQLLPFLAADVAEIIIIDGALSAADVLALHADYINQKFSLAPKSIFVALGNSIAAGGILTKDLVSINRDDLDIYLFGHPGEGLTQMEGYYPTEVAPLYNASRPHNIFSLYEFTNTTLSGDNGAAALAQYTGICDSAKADGFAALAAEPIPFYNATQPASDNARQTVVAALRASFAPSHGVGVIQYTDLTQFDAYGDIADGTYYVDAPNGVHPTTAGYDILSPVATAAVVALL